MFGKKANRALQEDNEAAEKIRSAINIYQKSQEFSLQYPVLQNVTSPSSTGAEQGTFIRSYLPEEIVSPGEPILIGYRYNFQPGDDIAEHKKFLNDSLFLPFQPDQREDAEKMQKELKSLNMLRQDEIKNTSSADLQTFYNQRTHIEIKDCLGNLDRSVDVTFDEQTGKGLRLRFTLEAKR